MFDPRRMHATMAWSGKRISITLYTVRAHDQVSGSDVDRLQELAFPGLTARHYLEASCIPHEGLEAEQDMACEHDFEAVFDGYRVSPPLPSMLKQMLSSAANWLSRHRLPASCPESHVQPRCAREPHGGEGGPGRPQPQEAFYECEEDRCGMEEDGATDPLDAGYRAQADGLRLLAHSQRPEGRDDQGNKNLHVLPQKEPQSSHCSGNWGTSPEVGKPQDLAVRTSRLSTRTGPSSMQSKSQGLVVDVPQVRQPMEEDEGQDDAEIPTNTAEDAKNVIDRRGGAYPKFLPAPRGRPEQGPREVELNSQGKAAVVLRQTRTTTRSSDHRGNDHDESWTSCFFGRGQCGPSNDGQERAPGGSSSSTPVQDAYEDPDRDGGARDLHRRRHVRRGHDAKSREELQVMISGEELERSEKAPLRGLCGDLRKRGWSMCALMIMFTLSSSPAGCTKTFLGPPVEIGSWSEGTGLWTFGQASTIRSTSWPSLTSPTLAAHDLDDQVRCYAFYKDDVYVDWMADSFGKEENLPKAATKDLQQALLKGGVDVSEVYSSPIDGKSQASWTTARHGDGFGYWLELCSSAPSQGSASALARAPAGINHAMPSLWSVLLHPQPHQLQARFGHRSSRSRGRSSTPEVCHKPGQYAVEGRSRFHLRASSRSSQLANP